MCMFQAGGQQQPCGCLRTGCGRQRSVMPAPPCCRCGLCRCVVSVQQRRPWRTADDASTSRLSLQLLRRMTQPARFATLDGAANHPAVWLARLQSGCMIAGIRKTPGSTFLLCQGNVVLPHMPRGHHTRAGQPRAAAGRLHQGPRHVAACEGAVLVTCC